MSTATWNDGLPLPDDVEAPDPTEVIEFDDYRPADDIVARTGTVALSSLSTDPPPPPLIDRLDPEGDNILYGPGGVLKGTVATWWAIQLTRVGHRVLIADYEHHPTEWSRRVFGLGGAELLADIWYVAPTAPEWRGRRGAIWDQADDLAALVRDLNVEVIIIDSLAYACLGADITDAATPPRYGAATQRIPAVVLSLAHVPKDRSANLAYPFGSVFWHNGARMTWSLEQNGERRILTCRKSNNYAPPAALEVEVTWLDGLPREVYERPYHQVLADRIALVIGDGAMNVRSVVQRLADEVTDETEKAPSEATVRSALNRGAKVNPPRFRKEGDEWQNI